MTQIADGTPDDAGQGAVATPRQLAAFAPLTVGIAGAGDLGHRFARALRAGRLARIVAVADPVPREARRFASAWGGSHWDSAAAMVEECELDAVIVCDPGVTAGQVVAWLDRRISVVWEGAPVVDTEGVREAVAVAGLRRAVFLYGATPSFSAEVHRVRSLLRSGVLGDLSAVDLALVTPRPPMGRGTAGSDSLGALGVMAIGLIHHLLGALSQVHATEGQSTAGRRVTSLWLPSTAGVAARVSLSSGAAADDPFHLRVVGTRGQVDLGSTRALFQRQGYSAPLAFGRGYDPQAARRRLIANLAAATLHGEETVVSRWSPVSVCVAFQEARAALARGSTTDPTTAPRVFLSQVGKP